MKKPISSLHEKALKIAQVYLGAESDLISVLQEIEANQRYLEVRCKNLSQYATGFLGLSADVAYNLIAIARKSREVPALQEKIRSQEITLSNARTIVSVLTPENQTEWLSSAAALTKRELVRAVADVNPMLLVPEIAKPVGRSRVEIRFGVSEELHEKIKHVQDLLSSRRGSAATLVDAVQAMTELFLEKEDPVRKAERAQVRAEAKARAKTETDTQTDPIRASTPEKLTRLEFSEKFVPGRKNNANFNKTSAPFPSEEEFMPRKTVPELPKRVPIPAALKHALNLRDQNRCTHHQNGKRCQDKRWLDFHHIIPVEMGGATTLENFTTLCRAHHRMMHS